MFNRNKRYPDWFVVVSRWPTRHRRATIIVVILLFIALVKYYLFLAPPTNFPTAQTIQVVSGQGVGEVAEKFYQAKVVRSPLTFKVLVRLLSFNGRIVAGNYRFEKPLSLIRVAYRLTSGDYGWRPAGITVPEGLNNKEVAKLLASKLPNFSEEVFFSLTKNLEGRLFPDTYFFTAGDTEWKVVKTMTDNFVEKTKPLAEEIKKSGKKPDDILIMASIIEKETKTAESRRIVSGILWNRLKIGMRLQVDATLDYLFDKPSSALTKADLASDSPFNTYRYAGLPPTPIANPGLDSIKAALNPAPSSYVYYLSDRNGGMHYAKTFEEHKENKARYLN